tara:strand:+ start:22219 stop:22557 length:339 start_codon:yes stop_codon:yes gene_type:complete
MSYTAFNRVTHFSIVWAVMLCFITIIEWRSLDRDPLKRDILSPFIQRDIQISENPAAGQSSVTANDSETVPAQQMQTVVELNFNGPLFLACFFIPIILFHGLGLLLARFQSH